ncbi:hypothetical protein WKH86_15830 [Xanthomonas oryzae pv. oryzae]|uniref:hypothetical protein n=1 Tax=Xanthomonas oryzae TaxID=347 RepID=UPI0015BF1EC6|nr:hypothetical protein [Xanthomonas oryzae]
MQNSAGAYPPRPCCLYLLPAASQAPAGLFASFAQTAEPLHIQDAALVAVVEVFHEAA